MARLLNAMASFSAGLNRFSDFVNRIQRGIYISWALMVVFSPHSSQEMSLMMLKLMFKLNIILFIFNILTWPAKILFHKGGKK
jgi:hypothetical protein